MCVCAHACVSARVRVCVCVREAGWSEGGPVCERLKREGESCLWEQDDPCDSACPSLCFPHSLTWAQLYPHHHIHIHKGLRLQTSPSLWFIAQWRAPCLLMVLPAAHGISAVFILSNKAAQNMSTIPSYDLCWRRDRARNFLRTMDLFSDVSFNLTSQISFPSRLRVVVFFGFVFWLHTVFLSCSLWE